MNAISTVFTVTRVTLCENITILLHDYKLLLCIALRQKSLGGHDIRAFIYCLITPRSMVFLLSSFLTLGSGFFNNMVASFILLT